MKTTNIERIYNALTKHGKVLLFINGNKEVSVTKDLTWFDTLIKHDRASGDQKKGYRIIGIYDDECKPGWIEADLDYFGFKAA